MNLKAQIANRREEMHLVTRPTSSFAIRSSRTPSQTDINSMVYIKRWAEFHSKCVELYKQSPNDVSKLGGINHNLLNQELTQMQILLS